MKKPAKLFKKSIKIKPCKEGGFRLIIEAARATLYSFAHHSPYWHCHCEMDNMIDCKDKEDKLKHKDILIGRWRWIDSETRKRVNDDDQRKIYSRLRKVNKNA